MKRRAGPVAGLAAVLVVWLLAGWLMGPRKGIPYPWDVVTTFKDDWHFYPNNINTTLWEAARGFFWGNLLAILTALAFLLVPFLEKILMQIAVATYCLPIIAIGPILQVVFDGDAPKVALAALACYFTTLIGTLVGLRAADRTSLEVVRVYGGRRVAELRKVRLRAALPATFAALQIAAPAAVLGAIIGEYLRGEKGLGVFMINSQQALNIPRTWGVALLSTLVAGVAFAVIGLVGRALTPWAPRTSTRPES